MCGAVLMGVLTIKSLLVGTAEILSEKQNKKINGVATCCFGKLAKSREHDLADIYLCQNSSLFVTKDPPYGINQHKIRPVGIHSVIVEI